MIDPTRGYETSEKSSSWFEATLYMRNAVISAGKYMGDEKSVLRWGGLAGIDPRVMLSTLWIFVSACYIFSDTLTSTLMAADAMPSGGVEITQEALLAGAMLMTIPFAMIVLSRVLKFRVNRWANIIAGAILAVVQVSTLFIGTQELHYIYFSAIEIATDLFIVWYAWKWLKQEERKAVAT